MSRTPRTRRLLTKIVLIAGGPRQEFELLAENTVGRSRGVTVRLDDPLVSKLHCKIVSGLGGWTLMDLGSENGTLVNGKRVREAVLNHGDQIRIGRRTFFFSATGDVPEIDSIRILPPSPVGKVEPVQTLQRPPSQTLQRPPSQTVSRGAPPRPSPGPKAGLSGAGPGVGRARGFIAIIGVVAVALWFGREQLSQVISGRPAEGVLGNPATAEEALTRGMTLEPATDDRSDTLQWGDLYRRTWALVIGIDRYSNLSRTQQLEYAVSDARAVEAVLGELGFDEVRSLYNQDATKEDILAAMDRFLGASEREDAAFVFFAGHGHTEVTAYGDVGYILPHDGSFESREMYRNISMSELSELSKRIKAKHMFFAMDSCYSGQLLSQTRGSNPPVEDANFQRLRSLTSRRVRQVLTAGGRGEAVLDGGPFGHSVFTGRLIEGLRGGADLNQDGFVTAAELEIYVADHVFEDARRRGTQQNPQFGRLFSGEGMFVFRTASVR